jgi:histidinol-phosphate aminotransferase
MESEFERLGLPYIASFGNFVLVRVGEAKRVINGLLKHGVIVRPVAGYGLPEWLRVTCGRPDQNSRFLKAFNEIL